MLFGNMEFFQSLIDDANLAQEAKERVLELIKNRNFFGVEEYLESIQVNRSAKEAFVALIFLKVMPLFEAIILATVVFPVPEGP